MTAQSQITIGVLALQGAFNEHIQCLRLAAQHLSSQEKSIQRSYTFKEVRNEAELNSCDGLIIPGGESTAISLVAQRCGMLEPLRRFVKVERRPTWGTCAGLILLAESANRTKKGGQELIGGLDVRVNRNHFGRQIESFQANLDIPFLTSSTSASSSSSATSTTQEPFRAIFIRAPIVEKLLPHVSGAQESELSSTNVQKTTDSETVSEDTVIAPSRAVDSKLVPSFNLGDVEVLAKLPGRTAAWSEETREKLDEEAGDIIAVRQANVFGTSFHPELTGDARIHVWWLERVIEAIEARP